MKLQQFYSLGKTLSIICAAVLLAACAETAPAQSEAPRPTPDSLEAAQTALTEAQDAYEKAVDDLIQAMEDYEAMKAEEAPDTQPAEGEKQEEITPEMIFGESMQALTDYLNENVVRPEGENVP